MPDHPGGQIDQILDDGLDAASGGWFTQREVISLIGNLTNEAQMIVGKQTAVQDQLIGFEFTRETNPYRTGGAAIKDSILATALNKKCNTIKIYT